MSPLFMDTGYKTSSPESMSAEENHSSNAGSEREGEGQLVGNRGARRQEKNRDAARKSRKKQTERADELHEELQSLERSNSALQKEIASLKKEFHHYTTVLEHHQASCALRASAATSTSYLSVPSSGDCRTPSGSLHSSPTQATAPSSSTSLTVRLGLDCTESSHLTSSTSAPPATSLESSTVSSAQVFTPSSSVTKPSSVPFSAVPSPLSLFCTAPPSLTPPRVTKSMPVCTSLISSSVPSSYIRTPDQPSKIHKSSPSSEKACTSTHAVGAFQASFVSPSLNSLPPYSSSVPQLHTRSFKENSVNLSPVGGLSLSMPQNPALLSPQPSFPVQPSCSQHNTTPSTSLLSLLTNPSPVNASQTTSNSLEGPPSDAPLPPQHLGDPAMDSLFELLEGNEWILGTQDNYLYR